MNRNVNMLILLISSIVYYTLSHTVYGYVLFLPIEVLVAFLHEFGHATMALVTQGHVDSLQVNPDGSGVTYTEGGNEALITMGGYIGSCIFSNILVRASLSKYTKHVCYIIAITSIFCGLYWFSNMTNLVILLLFAVSFFIMGRITFINSFLLQFIGIACVVNVLRDFDIGPSSDLDAFQQNVGILSYNGWMYTWLGIAIIVTFFNLKQIFSKGKIKA